MKKLVIGFLFLTFLGISGKVVCAEDIHIQQVTSPKGIVAWLVEDDHLPLVSVQIAWRGGVEQDPADKQGLAMLTMSLMNEGAGAYDAEAFQKHMADHAVQIGFSAGRDHLVGQIKFLSEEKKAAQNLLKLAVGKPRFDEEAIGRMKEEQKAALRSQLGNPTWQARYALFDELYNTHPYAMRSMGTEKSLNAITRDDVVRFTKAHLARDTMNISVVGAIKPDELAAMLDDVLGGLPLHADLRDVPEAPALAAPVRLKLQRKGTQTSLLFVAYGPKRQDKDWYAALVANYILGGGSFSSRLMQTVREEEGLTYGISTGLAPMDKDALIVGSFAAENDKAVRAWQETLRVWKGFYEQGASEIEIEKAKSYLLGELPLSLTSTGSIATFLTQVQEEKLGIDFFESYRRGISSVSRADVNRVLRRFFDPERLSYVAIGETEAFPADRERTLMRE